MSPKSDGFFAVEMKRHGFLEIADRFIDRLSLGDDRDLDALADISRLVAGPHDRLHCLLKLRHGYLPGASYCALPLFAETRRASRSTARGIHLRASGATCRRRSIL